jgi:NAD(P)H dehydrogenase (quinone)
MILVTGATGQLGRATIDFLLKKIPPSEIAALVRDPAKGEDLKNRGVELRKGDYTDYDSLVNAFNGIDKLLLISSSDLNDRAGQHINAINAAKAAGVKHIFYTSLARKNDDSNEFLVKSHIDTENYFKTAGITYTLLRNNFYSETIPMVTGEKVLETGTVFFPGGNEKIAYAARTDMAEATANILTGAGHEGKVYNFSGSESYSISDLAGIISGISGKKINYVNADKDVFKQELNKAGVPDVYIDLFISIGEIFKASVLDVPSNDLENILGRKPVTVEEYLKPLYAGQLV